VPGILSPVKITVKGAPDGRVFDGAQTAPPLSSDLPWQILATYRKDGGRARQLFTVSGRNLKIRASLMIANQIHLATPELADGRSLS